MSSKNVILTITKHSNIRVSSFFLTLLYSSTTKGVCTHGQTRVRYCAFIEMCDIIACNDGKRGEINTGMQWPSSETWMSLTPPSLTMTEMEVESASRLLSTSSLTAILAVKRPHWRRFCLPQPARGGGSSVWALRSPFGLCLWAVQFLYPRDRE